MKHLNTKLYMWILILISFIYYFITYLITNVSNDITIVGYLKPLPMVVTLDAFSILIFKRWIWKWNKLYPWFVPFPDLNGTWKGSLKSNWICPTTGETLDGIPTLLTINQSFDHISCTMRTGEMCSESFSAEICIDSFSKKTNLVYSYKSDPNANIRDRSQLHFGTAMLEIVNKNKNLGGEYWTSRETTGTIELEYWKKEKINTYPQELGKHPMCKT